MKFNLKAMALAGGLMWGGAILALALANVVWPAYGRAVLDGAASVYPGYHPGTGAGSVITGTLYAFADGAVAGALFGWLYNRLANAGNAA
jgi:hypothetical protein